jgi:hypothetical protein
MTTTRGIRPLLATLALAFAATWAWPAFAHHGWSGYEETARTLTGVVRSVAYESPHATIALESGERTWTIVLAPPSRLENRGLPKKDLVVGATATVEAYPHQSKKDELRAEWIEIGGRRTELR